jgi:integrase/recombinase XerD
MRRHVRSIDNRPERKLRATISRFLDHCRHGRALAVHTLRAYESDLADFRRFIRHNPPIVSIDRETIREYVHALTSERGLKETTVRRRVAVLKVFFRWLEEEKIVAISACHRLNLSIRLPRRLPRALHLDEMRKLLREGAQQTRCGDADERYSATMLRFAVATLFTTGMRVGELTNVCLSDVDVTDGGIRVRGKGNRERRVFFSGDESLKLLRQYLRARRSSGARSDRLLVDCAGHGLTTHAFRVRLRRLAAAAGIGRRITPHMLRHTAATQLIEAGVDIRYVQALLGHASIATTQIYTHVSNQSLRECLIRANTLRRAG